MATGSPKARKKARKISDKLDALSIGNGRNVLKKTLLYLKFAQNDIRYKKIVKER